MKTSLFAKDMLIKKISTKLRKIKQSGKHEFTKETRYVINKNYINVFISIYRY